MDENETRKKSVNAWVFLCLVTDSGEILITEGIAENFTLNEGRTETVRVLQAAG